MVGTQSCTTSDSTSPSSTREHAATLHQRKRDRTAHQQQRKQSEQKRCTLEKRQEEVGAMRLALRLSGRCGPTLDSLFQRPAGIQRVTRRAALKDGGRPLQERQWLLRVILARSTRRKSPQPQCTRPREVDSGTSVFLLLHRKGQNQRGGQLRRPVGGSQFTSTDDGSSSDRHG